MVNHFEGFLIRSRYTVKQAAQALGLSESQVNNYKRGASRTSGRPATPPAWVFDRIRVIERDAAAAILAEQARGIKNQYDALRKDRAAFQRQIENATPPGNWFTLWLARMGFTATQAAQALDISRAQSYAYKSGKLGRYVVELPSYVKAKCEHLERDKQSL